MNHGDIWPFQGCHSDERAHSLSFTAAEKAQLTRGFCCCWVFYAVWMWWLLISSYLGFFLHFQNKIYSALTLKQRATPLYYRKSRFCFYIYSNTGSDKTETGSSGKKMFVGKQSFTFLCFCCRNVVFSWALAEKGFDPNSKEFS